MYPASTTPPFPILPYPLTVASLPLPESPFESVSVPVPSLPAFSFAPSPKLVNRSLFGVLCALPFSAAFGDLLLIGGLVLFPPMAFLSASAGFVWLKSFHLRQPSKSMSACMQPHSITLRVSHSKFTGYRSSVGCLPRLKIRSRECIPWLGSRYTPPPVLHVYHSEANSPSERR